MIKALQGMPELHLGLKGLDRKHFGSALILSSEGTARTHKVQMQDAWCSQLKPFFVQRCLLQEVQEDQETQWVQAQRSPRRGWTRN